MLIELGDSWFTAKPPAGGNLPFPSPPSHLRWGLSEGRHSQRVQHRVGPISASLCEGEWGGRDLPHSPTR